MGGDIMIVKIYFRRNKIMAKRNEMYQGYNETRGI